MSKRTSRLTLIIVTCLVSSFFPQLFVSADIDEKYNKAWQHLGTKRLFSEPLGSEEAILWHLDYNGFAVRLPNSLMVFDYDNEIPAPQYDKKSEIGIVESLLTGVINPEELKDERVVFFFSHEHPAEKILKLLAWKDLIKDVLFVFPEEVYLKYESEIKALKEKESFDFNKKDVLSVILSIKPDHSYVVRGHSVSVPSQRAILNAEKKILYPGVEFIVQTTNGLTIYHSGSLMCRHCSDLKGILRLRNEEFSRNSAPQHKVISASTQTVRFVDGKLVTADKEESVRQDNVVGLKRLGFAVYSSPQRSTGYMMLYVTSRPQPNGVIGLIGGAGTFEERGLSGDAALKAREKEHLMEKDKFLSLRNPNFQADLGAVAQLEYEVNRISEYFDQTAGNAEVLQTLKKTAINRYTDYCDLLKQYCTAGVSSDECDRKVNAGEHAGYMFEVDYDDPSQLRAECHLFTTNDEYFSSGWIYPKEYFFGYCTSAGYALLPSTSLLWRIFNEQGN